jgi:hypothetical protein
VALAPNGGRLGVYSMPDNRHGYVVHQDRALELGSRPVFTVEGTGPLGAGLSTSTSSPNRPARTFGRPTASAPMVQPPCSVRWAIIPSICVRMQRLILSVASAPCGPVRLRPIVISSIANKKNRQPDAFDANLLRQPAFMQLKKDRPIAIQVATTVEGANVLINLPPFSRRLSGLQPQHDRLQSRDV